MPHRRHLETHTMSASVTQKQVGTRRRRAAEAPARQSMEWTATLLSQDVHHGGHGELRVGAASCKAVRETAEAQMQLGRHVVQVCPPNTDCVRIAAWGCCSTTRLMERRTCRWQIASPRPCRDRPQGRVARVARGEAREVLLRLRRIEAFDRQEACGAWSLDHHAVLR